MSSELHPTRIPVRLYYGTDGTHTYGRCRLARVQVTAVQQRRLPACMTRAPSSFNCLGGNCDSVILYACAPARGWLQRVRQYIDTFVHWSLVAVHYLLAGHHPPRPVSLSVRTSFTTVSRSQASNLQPRDCARGLYSKVQRLRRGAVPYSRLSGGLG